MAGKPASTATTLPRTNAIAPNFSKTLKAVLAGSIPMPDYWHTPSEERGAAVIAGVLHNQKRFIESGIVYNRHVIPNLPSDLAVEVPIVADAAGVHPVSLGPLPDARRQIAVDAGERATTGRRSGRAGLQRDRPAGPADRSGGQFHDRRSQAA